MKPEEHSAIINEIATNLNDPAKVTSLLTKIREDYTEVTTELVTAQETTKTVTKLNDDLQKYNMELFLSRGVKQETTNNDLQVEEKKLTYDDLDLSQF